MDYRYFPDPDLLPLEIHQDQIDAIKNDMPMLPRDRKYRYMATSLAQFQRVLMQQYDIDDEADLDVRLTRSLRATLQDMKERGKFFSLKEQEAQTLASSPQLADYLDRTIAALGDHDGLAANWVIGELSGKLNEAGVQAIDAPVKPEALAGLIERIADGTVSATTAKKVFSHMWDGEGDADTIIARRELKQISDPTVIEKMVHDVINANPKSVEEYKSGKEKALNALFGQVMKMSNKTANPAQVTEILKRRLSS